MAAIQIREQIEKILMGTQITTAERRLPPSWTHLAMGRRLGFILMDPHNSTAGYTNVAGYACGCGRDEQV